MSDAESYIDRAEEAERLARQMSLQDHRNQLMQIARDWREKATRAAAEEAHTVAKRERALKLRSS